MSYKDDLQIDQFALDKEWLCQPSLYAKYSEEAALADDEKNRYKERLDFVEAEVSSKIRENPKQYGLGDKVTETAIKEKIIQSPEYIKALEDYLNATKSAKIISIAVSAFEHKKAALTKLTDLFIANYWAQPKEGSIPAEMSENSFREKARISLENSPRLKRRKEE